MEAKRQAVQWINGSDKTGSNGVGNEDLEIKPGEDESVGKRGAPQIDVQAGAGAADGSPRKGHRRRRGASRGRHGRRRQIPRRRHRRRCRIPRRRHGRRHWISGRRREVPSDRKEETQEAALDPNEETREVPLNPKKETQETPSDSEEGTKNVAGLEAGSTDLKGLAVPARRKLTISRNLPPHNVNGHEESTGARRRERSSAAKFSADERGRRREECVDMRRRGLNDFAEEGGDTGADSEGRVTRAVNRQQAINAQQMGE